MFLSIKQLKKFSCTLFMAGSMLLCTSFKQLGNAAQIASWANHCLNQKYDPSADLKLKKWDLNINESAFIRFRKTYQNGKQEYYSMHLKKFDDLGYFGNTNGGMLQLKTRAADVIVQTYNDPKGDIDSMGHVLNIPLKNIQPECLDSLRNALLYLRDSKP
jgi:hypothetical protein